MSYNRNRGDFDLDQLGQLGGDLAKNKGKIAAGVFAVFALFAVWTMVYTVGASEEGVVFRFGKHVASQQPGLHWKLPWPIDAVAKVNTRGIRVAEFGFQTVSAGQHTEYAPSNEEMDTMARMVTGDLNLTHVEWIVQWRPDDAAKYLIRMDDVPGTIRDVSETVMRGLVGNVSVDDVLTTGRSRIAGEAKRLTQEMMDSFDCGVTVVTIELQDVEPPTAEVKDAFDGVNRARQMKETRINLAKGQRNKEVPAARGARDRAIKTASGYSKRVVKTATGQANAFLAKLAEYDKAPEATKARLYLEGMEGMLGNVDITVIDSSASGGTMPVLPFVNLDAKQTESR